MSRQVGVFPYLCPSVSFKSKMAGHVPHAFPPSTPPAPFSVLFSWMFPFSFISSCFSFSGLPLFAKRHRS